jgi:beta-lactamase class A
MSAVKKPKKPVTSLHPLHPKRVKHAAQRHYFSYMPNKKRHRVFIWVVFFMVVSIIAAQLLYPVDRALPMAKINDQSVGWTRDDRLAKMLVDDFNATKIKLTIGKDKSKEYSIKSIGAESNTQAMMDRLSNYPLWMRYIPLSIFFQSARVTTADVSYSDTVLQDFSATASKELSFEPINARLAIKDGQLVADGEVRGSVVTPESVTQKLKGASLRLGSTTTITLPSERSDAGMTMQDLETVRAQAEAALGKSIKITISGQAFEPGRTTIASWLVIGNDAAGKATLSIDAAKVNEYLEMVNTKVGTPPGQTDVTIVNGRETGRSVGPSGLGINRTQLQSQLSELLLAGRGSATIAAELTPIAPTIIYNSKYTATQEGLQAYVTDVSRSKNVRISIQQLTGERWSAAARADESTPSASTFKLFISLMLFDKMEKGEIRWSDPMLDTTVAGCFNRMTIASTNPCAEKWISDWGRGNINAFVYSRGFSQGTAFTAGEAVRTTANDLTRYMIGLHDGSVVKEPYRSQLLHNLFIHPYQEGVPTGSAGVVHNKVGFLWDYTHDTAIVEHPRGTYVITVMTKGQSYSTIAAITREVERIMYP